VEGRDGSFRRGVIRRPCLSGTTLTAPGEDPVAVR
jgi:hypothetical protein